ncbi:MAG: peptidylprolyl isomerase [Candidatus Marinimicrobia bacterium]|nr:peptidylprolyl isomerase [Candidatus Neomarinimicrobiota bacterium]
MHIQKDKVVSIDYTLTNNHGEVLDSSSGREPLAYLHGNGGLIPGLEKELEGKVKGDKLVAIIAPEQAYGLRTEELVQEIPLKNFHDASEVKVGVQFQVENEHEVRIATVTAVGENSATVDMNHPLADETLHFDVEVMDVREPTKEEMEHGHVHGAGGHHH